MLAFPSGSRNGLKSIFVSLKVFAILISSMPPACPNPAIGSVVAAATPILRRACLLISNILNAA